MSYWPLRSAVMTHLDPVSLFFWPAFHLFLLFPRPLLSHTLSVQQAAKVGRMDFKGYAFNPTSILVFIIVIARLVAAGPRCAIPSGSRLIKAHMLPLACRSAWGTEHYIFEAMGRYIFFPAHRALWLSMLRHRLTRLSCSQRRNPPYRVAQLWDRYSRTWQVDTLCAGVVGFVSLWLMKMSQESFVHWWPVTHSLYREHQQKNSFYCGLQQNL